MTVVEWPGGEPTTIRNALGRDAADQLRKGRVNLQLPKRPNLQFLALHHRPEVADEQLPSRLAERNILVGYAVLSSQHH